MYCKYVFQKRYQTNSFDFICRVSNGTPSGPSLTYSNLENMAGGNLGWEEKPLPTPVAVVENRSNREEQRKPQTPSETQTHQYQQQQQVIQRNSSSRPELTDLMEAMNQLRARKLRISVAFYFVSSLS